MSKQYLLKISGLAALTLLLFSPAFAQDKEQKESKDTLRNKDQDYDEIIVRPKKDKDVKVTVEVRDGQVLVNGKPVAEFDDNNVSIIKKKVRVRDGSVSVFSGPGEIEEFGDHMAPEPLIVPDMAYAPMSPFRKHSGTMSVDGNRNRAFLGVTSKPEEEGGGAKITAISKGSAAEKAGLREGDIITKIDEIKIGDPDDLSEAVHKYKPTDKVTVTYKREGKEAKVTAILGKSLSVNRVYNYNYDYAIPKMKEYQFKQMPPMQFSWDAKPRLGIKAQDTEDGKGVKVLEVGEESAAEKAGIKEGDIITSFDGKEVNSAVTLAELARDGKDKPSIKVGLIREGKAKEIEVKIPKKLKTANL
ncbi:MAG TPA: PDZ domain-containing protein [Puia sp.]|jgi:serine protease Do|nr:PDZ domain-containing protein [Puia sp.]